MENLNFNNVENQNISKKQKINNINSDMDLDIIN